MSKETKPQDAEQASLPEIDVKVEDAGTLKKKVSVTVPRQRIDAKSNEMFGELGRSAAVPGFRIGHAPRRLLEKRFGKEVTQDVRNALVGESLGSAIEKAALKTLGEPNLDLDKIELPNQGDLTFSFEVEIAPDIALPELKGIKVNRPVVNIDEARVDAVLDEWRTGQARYEKTDAAAKEADLVVAGVKLSGEGIETVERKDVTLRVAPGQVEGIPLVDLGKELAGRKAGQTVTMTVTAPASHPNEAWRGKQAAIELTLTEVRQRILPEINEDFAKQAGFPSLAELREQARKQMEVRAKAEVQQAMRDQIAVYLMEAVQMELPEGVVNRQTARLLQRRYVELLYRGVTREKIEENLTQMQAEAAEQAKNDLKLSFILGKVATDMGLTVDEGEVNARVAAMARQNNRRPERMRQELAADGTLSLVEDSLKEEKAIDKLLEQAEITDVTPEQIHEAAKAKKAKAEKADKGEKAPKAAKAEKADKADKGDKAHKAEKAPAKTDAEKPAKKPRKKTEKKEE